MIGTGTCDQNVSFGLLKYKIFLCSDTGVVVEVSLLSIDFLMD